MQLTNVFLFSQNPCHFFFSIGINLQRPFAMLNNIHKFVTQNSQTGC